MNEFTISTVTGSTFKMSELEMPRLRDDSVVSQDDEYLHWSALDMIFWHLYPEGSITPEVVEDTDEYVKMKCEIRKNRNDEKPAVSCIYKMQYDDDVCDTFVTCQTMAVRTALILGGIGIDKVFEDEKARRQQKRDKYNELKESNVEKSPAEIFDAMAAQAEKRAKKSAEKADPFKEEGVASDTKQKAPAKAEEPSPEKKEEPAKAEGSSAEKEEEPKKAEPKPKRRGRRPKSESPGPEYVIKEGDFQKPAFEKKYVGKKLKEIGPTTLRMFLLDKASISEDFKEILEKSLK